MQQFSAGLSQYKMKRFGGFKVAKVLKELQRGKHLVSEECATLQELPVFVQSWHLSPRKVVVNLLNS